MKKERKTTGESLKTPAAAGDGLQGEGVIIAHLGVAVEVLFAGGGRQQVRTKRRSGHVVGDLVTVAGEVLTRLPRKTELRRRDAAGIHLVGANLNVLGVVVAPLPAPPSGFIDRGFVAARAAGLEPFLVINKCDLEGSDEMVTELQAVYGGSAPIFPVCAATGRGFELLEGFLGKGRRGAFVGITGVGKSSLLNALCPEIDLRVGALNDYNDRGRHTTTVSTLHTLAAGGELIDTPGFQDFGLVDITAQQLALHFPGFEETCAVACRFRDCRHRTEPGCAVAEMVDNGGITAERYETYLEILTEVEASEEENRRRNWK